MLVQKMDWTTTKNCVCSAVRTLISKDEGLLAIGANERSLTHRLAIYLEREIQSSQKTHEDWIVDCEYNRLLDRVKTLNLPIPKTNGADLDAKTVYPDIIVHRRLENLPDSNLLVIEAKKGTPSTLDKEKLEAFVSLKDVYKYQHGLFLGFNRSSLFEVILYKPDSLPRHSKDDDELKDLIAEANRKSEV